ncbi:MAG TPA: glycosyltransferase family 39 protein [Candidatus Binataceae bacterium]|nr:glycosyltransferase family 39 protein [Candidatus Binataceae bacterium]
MPDTARTEPLVVPGEQAATPALAALWRSATVQALSLLALASAIFFFHLGSYGLWEPDEARYAEIAREMLAGGGLIVPHLNYVPYVEKPPLLYWLSAAWMAIFGVNEFAARLTPALAALVGVLATWFFARRAMDPARALLAGAILATSILYAVMAQVLTTDMLLTATLTVAWFAMFLHWREGGRWCWAGYAAIALGVLAKGPVAAVVAALTLAIFLWWEGELRGAMRRFHVVAGGALVAVIAAPWFIVLALREPGFADFYFVGEYLRRFFQPSFSHGEPLYYYAPVLLGGLMPWTLFAPFIAWRALRRTPAGRFCVVAAAVVLTLFSAASGKLIPYILPAFAPIAVLMADGLLARASPNVVEEKAARVTRLMALPGVILIALGAAMLIVGTFARSFKSPYVLDTRSAIYALAIIGLIGGLAVVQAFRRWRMAGGFVAFTLVAAVGLGAGSYIRLEAEPLRSYASFAREIAARAPEATLVCYPHYVQALPFYTRRRVLLVGDPTELAFGEAHSRDAHDFFFRSEADALRLWNRPGPVVMVIDPKELRALRDRLGKFTVIATGLHKSGILKTGGAPAGRSAWNR